MSIGGFVPKPHTPFQWAGQAAPEVVDDRLRKLRAAINADRSLGRNIGMRYHDGQPSLIEGLLSRGDRRVGAVIEQAWRAGAASTAGASTSPTSVGWTRQRQAFGDRPVDVGLVHHPGAGRRRDCCPGTTSIRGWTSSGSGTTGRTR